MITWKVVVRRNNGRILRTIIVRSKYAAKRKAYSAREKYDDSYTVEITEQQICNSCGVLTDVGELYIDVVEDVNCCHKCAQQYLEGAIEIEF